jgi:hypothetical protein
MHQEVYDLVNCGPRHRYVVAAGGAPLVVHNCENITQAVARDLLAEGLINAEAARYPVVLHVHDEILAEVPDADDYTVDGLIVEMTKLPGWAEGLPLAAAGFEAYRYRKE